MGGTAPLRRRPCGDRRRCRATIHHRGVTGRVELTLQSYVEGAGETTYPKAVEVKGDGPTVVDFEPMEVGDARELKLTLKGKAATKH